MAAIYRFVIFYCTLCLFINGAAYSQDHQFDFKRILFGTPPTITLSIQTLNAFTGAVTINGGDSQAPSVPFIWNWSDGNITNGFFPQSHKYTDNKNNYVVKVIASYPDNSKDSAEILVRFTSPTINKIEIPSSLSVRVPDSMLTLGTRLYSPPDNLTFFDNSHFTGVSRDVIEYVLSICAVIQNDFVNNNVFHSNDKFEQVMLRDSTFAGAYSLWFTNPVAFGVGEGFLKDNIQYSSFFHEMGHNFTLNTPADYYFGGKIDGNANAIYSESMANIFAHAAGYEIVNNSDYYGLSPDLVFDIKQSLISSVSVIKTAYNRYVSYGKYFASWNNPNTIRDETFDTFMTLAYKFLEKAEISGLGYKTPLQRMLKLLQGFNADWSKRYDQQNNTSDADTFRATLMSTAISYAFSTDLRDEFRNLSFPISDTIFDELNESVATDLNEDKISEAMHFYLNQNYPNPFNPVTTIDFSIPYSTFVSLTIYDDLGRLVEKLISGKLKTGNHSVRWNASEYSSGVYYCCLSADGLLKTRKLLVLR